MKFRTISRLIYLRRARHRGGHGIHSPFLFRLITAVIEDKQQYPEYQRHKDKRIQTLRMLTTCTDPSLSIIYNRFNINSSKPKKLLKKTEFPARFTKLIFRLIREFKPASVFHYGPSLGVNLSLIALATRDIPVSLICNDPEYNLLTENLRKDPQYSNIVSINESQEPSIPAPFTIINYPHDPQNSRKMIQKCIAQPCSDGILIIRGIHESKEMYNLWKELIANIIVRVSIDQFEIGIAMFRKGLQKEDFIHRF